MMMESIKRQIDAERAVKAENARLAKMKLLEGQANGTVATIVAEKYKYYCNFCYEITDQVRKD